MVAKTPELVSAVSHGTAGSPPKYADDVVSMIGAPPYRFEGLTIFSFFLKETDDLLSAELSLVDKFLNEPLGCSGRNGIFRAATMQPLLIFSKVERSYSIPGGAENTIAYQEVSLLIPVVVKDLKTVGYLLPILFVDGPPGGKAALQAVAPIVIGRELYGLPKVPAEIVFKSSGTKFELGEVSLFGKTLIRAQGKADHPQNATGPAKRLTDGQRKDFAEKLFGPIDANEDFTRGRTKGGHSVDLVHVGHGNPLIGLRQLRAPGHFENADYQEVIESPYDIDPPCIPYPLGNTVHVEFDQSTGIFKPLGLQPTYEITDRADGVVYPDITANFGEPTATVVRQGYP